MAALGTKSKEKLSGVHPDLKRVVELAIKDFDFTVVFGHRTVAEQFELYKKGRKLVDGKWIKIGATVTNLDGITKKSNHNYYPSKAVDLAPWTDGGIDWNNLDNFKKMATAVLKASKALGVNVTWGGNWKSFKDYPHFEIK